MKIFKEKLNFLLLIYLFLTCYIQYRIHFQHKPVYALVPSLTVFGSFIAFAHAKNRMGWKRSLQLFFCVFLVSFIFEVLGIATGIVYGEYHYSFNLGAHFFGVPVVVPFSWFMMMYPSWILAQNIFSYEVKYKNFLISMIASIIMTSWDLVLDPLMSAGNYWVWETPGAYFGVPLQNYFGWLVTTFTAFSVFQFCFFKNNQEPIHSGTEVQMIAFFVIVALGNMIGASLDGLAAPAMVCFFSVFPWILFSWVQLRTKK